MIIIGSRQKTLEELESLPAAVLAPVSPEEIAKAKPRTWIETGGKQKEFFGEKKRNRETLKKYRDMYEQGGLVSTALDLYPLFILSNGYRLEGDNNNEIKDWLDSINFPQIVWQAVSDAIVFGDAFQENVGTRGNGGEIITLAPRSPIDFNIDYDDKGIIKSYTQVQDENTGTGTKLKPDQITHLVLLPQSGSLYGLSLMKRAYDDIIRDTKVADASSTAMFRHGFKKYHVKVGREAELIPDDILDDIRKKFEDIEVKNEFITPHDIEIKNIDEGGLEKIEEYNDVSLMRVAAALGVPEELVGLKRSSTDNTGTQRIKAFYKKIQTFQGFVAQCYNTNVIDRKTGTPGKIRLIWNDPDPSDENLIATYISKVMMASPQDPFAVFPVQWIQKRFNIESGELDNEPATKPSQEVPEQKGQEQSAKEPPGIQQPLT
jgi:hypothetical protein